MNPLESSLRAADPAHGVEPYDAKARSALWDRVRTVPLKSSAVVEELPWYRGARQRVVLAAAAVSVAALVTSTVVDLPWLGPVGTSAPAAAALLGKAALTASDPPARNDQYFRIRSIHSGVSTESTAAGEIRWRTPGESIRYVAVDGTRPQYEVNRQIGPAEQVGGPRGRAPQPWDASTFVRTSNLSPIDFRGSWQTPHPRWLAELPRDVGRLKERLYRDAQGRGPSHDGEVLVLVADVLRSGIVPADLRRSLYRVLEGVPGVQVMSDSVVVDGRPGVSIGRNESNHGQRQEIILDPGTGEVIGERYVSTEAREQHDPPPGTVLGQRSLTREVVDDIPADVRSRAKVDRCTVEADGSIPCTGGD